ncbi:helix-turn-helix transcriptional regulator [Rhodopirellula sp. JC639]|uniref:helix-turn-helix transcriptional regulator n=1 Tax=Stieleria mannarensis TaxID=2755585 RepID=UPI00256FA805|nr:HTH domain-containing protein [Rhodopirellula sp. JC639]
MRRADRLFRIVEYLKARREAVTGEELAAEMDIGVRTIYRDVADLRSSGVPIVGEAGSRLPQRPVGAGWDREGRRFGAPSMRRAYRFSLAVSRFALGAGQKMGWSKNGLVKKCELLRSCCCAAAMRWQWLCGGSGYAVAVAMRWQWLCGGGIF